MRHCRLTLLPLLLSACVVLCAGTRPVHAQNSSHKTANGGGGRPNPALILGVGLAGLILGAGVASALRKPTMAAKSEDSGPGPIFEDVPMPVAVLDHREKVQKANKAYRDYFGLDVVEGSALVPLFHPDEVARNRTLLQEVFGGDRAEFSVQTRFFHPDGAMLSARLFAKRIGEKRKPDTILVAIEDATRRVEAESELEGAKGAIHALYDVIAGDTARDFDAKIKALLSMGCNLFELPIGVLSQLTRTESGPQLETLFVQSPDRRIRPALHLPLSQKDSVEAELLGIPFLSSPENWRDMPFVAHNGERAYFGAPVVADGKLFGMLSFSKIETHERDFGSGDIEVLQLMAEWVGGEFEREHTRAELEANQTALLEANSKLEAMATIDSLTEIKNRRAFNEKLAEEWARAMRYGTALSMILLDVDNFKAYNDTYGHPAGDEVLKRVARVLTSGVRGTDFLARYGGEEFVLLLPNTDADGAMILAERLRQKLETAQWKERAVTASLGVASVVPSVEDASTLTSAADSALYGSKTAGRNRVTHARDMPGAVAEPQGTA